MSSDTYTENATATGFTYVTTDCKAAFQMAERLAFEGYSIKLSGVKGGDWTVEVSETDRPNQHKGIQQ